MSILESTAVYFSVRHWRDLAEPGLRWAYVFGWQPLPASRRPGLVRALLGPRTAPRPVGNAHGRHTTRVTSPGRTTSLTRPVWPQPTNAGARPPREGSALCQGVAYCGACGCAIWVRRQDRYRRYVDSHSRADLDKQRTGCQAEHRTTCTPARAAIHRHRRTPGYATSPGTDAPSTGPSARSSRWPAKLLA